MAAAGVSPPIEAVPGTWASVVPPVLAIVMSLLTRRLYLSLFAGIISAGWLLAAHESMSLPATLITGSGFAGRFVVETLVDPARGTLNLTNLLILVYVVLIMVAIAVMVAAGGFQALADRLIHWARSRRQTQIAAYLAGLIVFIDDYANTMIVGSTFRTMTDRQRISRAKLAFIVDSTAAPVAGVALLSTWIGYEVGLLGEVAASLGITQGGYELFVDAIGFRYYCFTMLIFVMVNALFGIDFGPMRRAEERAQLSAPNHGSDTSNLSLPTSPLGAVNGPVYPNIWTTLAPLGVLIAVFLGGVWLSGGGYTVLKSSVWALVDPAAWRKILASADSITILALASACCLVSALLWSWGLARMKLRQIARAMGSGLTASLLPVSVLILAWALKRGCDALGTGSYLAGLLSGNLWPPVFPMLVFLVACGCSFATGTSWGTMAILLPTALPVAFALDGQVYGLVSSLCVASVLDGAIFGDHCSPISDTTIMSAAAAGCDQIEHVQTQLPYATLVAAIALVAAYLPAGFGVASWVGLLAATGCVLMLFASLGLFRQRKS